MLSVSRNSQVRLERDAFLAQAGGFAVAPALSVESALQKIGTLPFSVVILGPSLSLAEKRRFVAATRGRKLFSVISIHHNGDADSGADLEIDETGPYQLIRAIERLS